MRNKISIFNKAKVKKIKLQRLRAAATIRTNSYMCRLENIGQKKARLALHNPEYAYVCDKQYPDPILPYDLGIKEIINNIGI